MNCIRQRHLHFIIKIQREQKLLLFLHIDKYLIKIKLNMNENQREKRSRFMMRVINTSLLGSYAIPKFKFFTVRLKNVPILMDKSNY